MSLATWGKSKLQGYIQHQVKIENQKFRGDMEALLPQLIEFQTSPIENRLSYYTNGQNGSHHEDLRNQLTTHNIPVEDIDIDIADFERWLKSFSEIKQHYQYDKDNFLEKCLEHYLVFQYLNISDNDVYIDVGADESPWAETLNNRGIKSYRLDLSYPAGIHGLNIGANASNTKLPNAFASVLSLQHSYGHFVGDADIQFVWEAARILNNKGRCGIIPFYFNDTHFVATSPLLSQQDLVIEDEAKHVWRDDGYKVPYSRHYSVKAFKDRIFANIPADMTGKVLYFRNLNDVMRHYQEQKLVCFFMFYCEKTNP